MSNEYSNEQSESGNAGGSEDLAGALAGPETEFVATEEKKPATQGLIFLAVLVVVGIGGTYFMYARQGPATAAAAASPEAQKAEQTINTFLTSGPDGIKMMQSMLKDTEKVVKQFLEYPSVTQIPLANLHTNPFKAAGGKDSGTAAPVTEDVAQRRREEEKQAALKASDNLKLQSIIYSGSRKACMINNSMYQEGQQIEQFVIEKIEQSRVIVKTGAYRFELKAKR
ncbi:MAG: hypothetical protein QOF78_2033 [Phycisphaerales bacterium]|jgi:hypothetical protein|nr:hypothetical protein [Phycisphaerales bacterium]